MRVYIAQLEAHVIYPWLKGGVWINLFYEWYKIVVNIELRVVTNIMNGIQTVGRYRQTKSIYGIVVNMVTP